jgi:hypothetical protein
MKDDGLGAGRHSRKPRPVLRFERFGKTGGLEDLVFYCVSVIFDGFGAGISVHFVSKNLVFLKGWLCKHSLGQCFQRVGRPRARLL